MARKGKVIWELRRERYVEGVRGALQPYTRIDVYALRDDGVLIRKLVTRRPDPDTGRLETYDYGWKIETRKPNANVKEILEKNGFTP